MTHRPVATVGRPTAGGEPLGPAVASFLAERDLAPSSHRVYVLALDRLLDRLGADTPPRPGEPTGTRRLHDRDLPPPGPGLLQAGGRHPRLAVRLHHLPGLDLDLAGYRPGTPPPPVGSGRARPRPGHPRARAARLPRHADHPVREKTLWWLLYETAARAGEVLALNVADLDPARRRAGS